MDGLRMYSYIYGGNTNVNGGNIYVNLGKASKMQHNASPWRINYVGLSHTHHHPVRACNTLLITIFIILVVTAITISITFTITIPFPYLSPSCPIPVVLIAFDPHQQRSSSTESQNLT